MSKKLIFRNQILLESNLASKFLKRGSKTWALRFSDALSLIEGHSFEAQNVLEEVSDNFFQVDVALQLPVRGKTPDHQVVLPGPDLKVLDPSVVAGHPRVGVLDPGLHRLRNFL